MDSRMKTADAAIYLLRCMVHYETPDEKVLDQIDMDELFKFGEFHKINACLGYALRNSHVDNRWSEAMNKAIYRTMMFDNERKKITDFMNESGIWYCCLKGLVLQHYYPEYGIREFSDNDILFDSSFEKQVHDYFVGTGYKVKSYGIGHHDEYMKKPFFNFEMHTKLFDAVSGDLVCDYYKNEHDKLQHNGTKMELVFSNEDFYIYYIAHAFKHFSEGGTGIRTLLDINLYTQSNELNYEYVSNQLGEIGLKDKESIMRSLSAKLFDINSTLSNAEINMLKKIVSSGAYGTIENRVSEEIEKKGNVAKYIISRLFPDETIVKVYYPYAYKYKVLYPVMWIHRIIKAVTISRKKVLSEFKAINSD